MLAAVIDTNVLLVANGQNTHATLECQANCVKRLLAQRETGVTVIDDGYRLLSEYQNKTHPNQPKGVGDSFLKWLLQNQRNVARVHRVTVTETTKDIYAEFPDAALQPIFDASDRKFVAVAHAHRDKPPIWQASDSKWAGWWSALQVHGVNVEFLCPSDVRSAYRRKFPRRRPPALPGD